MTHDAKGKVLNAGLIFTSLLGYLEWGKSNSQFLFQAEWEVLTKLFTDPMSVLHPFTVLPMIGQCILLFTIFQRKPSRWLTFLGMGGLSFLLLFMFLIGVMSLNYKILLFSAPFVFLSIVAVRYYRQRKG